MGDIKDYMEKSNIENISVNEEVIEGKEASDIPEEAVRKGRGPNKEWSESEMFEDATEYYESVFKRHFVKQMSKNSMYNTKWAIFEAGKDYIRGDRGKEQ